MLIMVNSEYEPIFTNLPTEAHLKYIVTFVDRVNKIARTIGMIENPIEQTTNKSKTKKSKNKDNFLLGKLEKKVYAVCKIMYDFF